MPTHLSPFITASFAILLLLVPYSHIGGAWDFIYLLLQHLGHESSLEKARVLDDFGRVHGLVEL